MEPLQRENFVNECVELLSKTSKRFGYSTISIETLKMIFITFCKRYSPPKKPKNSISRTENNAIPKPPPMYGCGICKKAKPASEMYAINLKDSSVNICKNCEKKEQDKKILRPNFKR